MEVVLRYLERKMTEEEGPATQFLYDENIPSGIIGLIRSASSKLIIVSPYLKLRPRDHLSEALEGCIKRGVQIAVFCRKNPDNPSHAEALDRLKDGITELVFDELLHAKMIIADAKRLLVTSANLTESSQTRNHETGILTDESTLVSGAMRYLSILRDAPEAELQQFCRKYRKLLPKFDLNNPWCYDCWQTLPIEVKEPYMKAWRDSEGYSDRKR